MPHLDCGTDTREFYAGVVNLYLPIDTFLSAVGVFTFATVRLRTYRTKGPGSRLADLAMTFKLAQKAQQT